MAKIEIDTFLYQPVINVDDIDIRVYTTPVNGIINDVDLDDAERHVVNLIHSDPKYREIIANRLREIADEIQYSPEYNMKGYIRDYDGYDIEEELKDEFNIIDIDWKNIKKRK
jgi:hypothetical protein